MPAHTRGRAGVSAAKLPEAHEMPVESCLPGVGKWASEREWAGACGWRSKQQEALEDEHSPRISRTAWRGESSKGLDFPWPSELEG